MARMTSILPINADDLVSGRTESARIEFKAAWDPETTGPQVLRTICAFANDFHNLNGGYVLIGVAEGRGADATRVVGLDSAEMDLAQRWIGGRCRGEMEPSYAPVLSPEKIQGRDVLVVWVPASQDRPHRARSGGAWPYWIRVGSETVDAEKAGYLNALRETAAPVAWDNQAAYASRLDDLREGMVREYLHDVRSALREEPDAATIYRNMRLTAQVNNHEVARNVGLLFFADDPEQWFPGARIVVARFAADRPGEVLDEHVFRGPLAGQVRSCLRHLEGMSRSHVQKRRERSQVHGWVSYPIPALREALVNAVYHRSYRPDAMEPTKICLYPDRIEVISYPGAVPGIEPDHLAANASIPPVSARNPRVGEFLKTLGLAEGWHTGLPKIYGAMRENGSPPPSFDFDNLDKGWFRVTLPAHPEYAAVSAIEDAAYLRTVNSKEDAFRRIHEAWQANASSAVLSAELIRLLADREQLDEAELVFERFRQVAAPTTVPNVANTWIEVLLNGGREDEARRQLRDLDASVSAQDAVDAAILARRLRESRIAHRYFEQASDAMQTDARALHEFAQTKIWLAQEARFGSQRSRAANRRLLIEARGLLERVVQMDASSVRLAWAWRDLARVLNWLRLPAKDVQAAFQSAIGLLPDERRFRDELRRFQERAQNNNRHGPMPKRNSPADSRSR